MDIDEVAERLKAHLPHSDKVAIAYALTHSGLWREICEADALSHKERARAQKMAEATRRWRAKKAGVECVHDSKPAEAVPSKQHKTRYNKKSDGGGRERSVPPIPPSHKEKDILVREELTLSHGEGGGARVVTPADVNVGDIEKSDITTSEISQKASYNEISHTNKMTPKKDTGGERHYSLGVLLNQTGYIDGLLETYKALDREKLLWLLDGANAIFKAKVTGGRTKRGVELWLHHFITNKLQTEKRLTSEREKRDSNVF